MKRLLAIVALSIIMLMGIQAKVVGKLQIELEWTLHDGTKEHQVIDTPDIAYLAKEGFWLSFMKKGNDLFAVVQVGPKSIAAKRSSQKMKQLGLRIIHDQTTYHSAIFGKEMLFGPKEGSEKNTYHFLILDDFVTQNDLIDSLAAKSYIRPEKIDSFRRTQRLAVNFAVQSDSYTRTLEKLYGVTAHYAEPRIIMIAEEWIKISEKTQAKPKRSGGLFGGALDNVAAEIAGETKTVTKFFPTYAISVINDRIEAKGKHPMSFQVARSLWDDILESKVIYESAPQNGRVLSASVVFFQMQKNKAKNKSKNRLVSFGASKTNTLDQLPLLWPEAKTSIKNFHAKNNDWLTVLPKDPVLFFDTKGKVKYATYAWFHVHPSSGRMIGVLPRETNGGENELRNQIEKKAISMTKDAIEKAAHPGTSAVKLFLSTVAGMYVSSAGVLDALNMTIADPGLANMSDADWKKFLAEHSMTFCNDFIKEHADAYDSYETIAGFWMGACAITNRLGGPGPGGTCLKNGYNALKDKAISDAKAAGEKALGERVEGWEDSRRKDLAETLNETKDTFVDLSEKMGNAQETVDALKGM